MEQGGMKQDEMKQGGMKRNDAGMLTALLHPKLADCRRLFLRNYEVLVNIGVHDFEKRGEQRVIINIDLFVLLAHSTPHEDKLHEVVDYDFMRATVAARIAQGHIQLQETLCDDLMRALLAHEHVRAARISTEKPDVYADCDAVGVEIFCIKDE
jgi:dihydroneopterin aldolase